MELLLVLVRFERMKLNPKRARLALLYSRWKSRLDDEGCLRVRVPKIDDGHHWLTRGWHAVSAARRMNNARAKLRRTGLESLWCAQRSGVLQQGACR
jgi:hypothetical protein